jgi:hypothetical protein
MYHVIRRRRLQPAIDCAFGSFGNNSLNYLGLCFECLAEVLPREVEVAAESRDDGLGLGLLGEQAVKGRFEGVILKLELAVGMGGGGEGGLEGGQL